MTYIIRSLFLICLLSFSSFATAAGPVPASSLPGNVTFQDSDPGNGESWGRVGGRDWTFSGFDTSLFNSLTWSLVGPNSVGISFDGTINAGTAEELSLSSVNGNVAIWNGSTRVFLQPGSVLTIVDTQFVLTLTSNGVATNFSTSTINGLPYVDVISLTDPFSLNLRMEARLAGETVWEPALDLFDRLSTDPTVNGLARVSLHSGFFFELVGSSGGGSGLTLEEHDENMVNKGNQLANDIDFLKGETVGRLEQLLNRTQTIEQNGIQLTGNMDLLRGETVDRLSQLLNDAQTIEQLIRQIPIPDQNNPNAPTADEIRNIVAERVNELTQILIFLWGVDTSQGPPDPSTVTLVSDLARFDQVQALQQQLATLQQQLSEMEQRLSTQKPAVNMQMEVVSGFSGKHHGNRLLLLVKVNGLPVEASVVDVKAVSLHRKKASSLEDVAYTTRALAPGLLELKLDRQHHNRHGRTLVIRAAYEDTEGESHYDTRMVSGLPYESK